MDFHQFTNGNGMFIGVDFSSSPNDFSVETVMNKRSDGVIEIVSSNIIGRNMSHVEKQKIIKHYERLCSKEAIK